MFKDRGTFSLLAKSFLIMVGSLMIAVKSPPGGETFGLALILLGVGFLFLPDRENRLAWMLGWVFLAAALACLAMFISTQFTR
jgi:protein-S-isoprenylcysteine O-methyltransferase Ste14